MTLLVLPATWTLFEWTRGWLFTGFPWLATGYAHNASPLAGFAPIVGAYGLGWLAALSGWSALPGLPVQQRQYQRRLAPALAERGLPPWVFS